jgi:hypothetical protein
MKLCTSHLTLLLTGTTSSNVDFAFTPVSQCSTVMGNITGSEGKY